MPAPLQMREELARPATSGLAARRPALWSTAPAWRNLAICACFLTALAISTPMVLPRPDTVPGPQSAPQPPGSPIQADLKQRSCATARIPDAPLHVTGRVTRRVSREQALAAIRAIEASVGAQLSPAYLPLESVYIEAHLQSGVYPTMVTVPADMTVKTGDMVELTTRYRDPSLPCHFIPWKIDRLLSHPAQ
jgi:hypothetical protein